MEKYLQETPIVDFDHVDIRMLVHVRGWNLLTISERIANTYNFVKDEIKFGYNARDDVSASQVLKDGYGQCNTKGSLLMALLRALKIPCRFHGFTINKSLQQGAIPNWLIPLTPQYILHSWVEVLFNGQWINLEGFILDKQYLNAIQNKFSNINGSFCGYGIATKCLVAPQVEWKETDTYIQKEGIHQDFGIFDSPDDFYKKYGVNLSGVKRMLYQFMIRHLINLNVKRLRLRRI